MEKPRQERLFLGSEAVKVTRGLHDALGMDIEIKTSEFGERVYEVGVANMDSVRASLEEHTQWLPFSNHTIDVLVGKTITAALAHEYGLSEVKQLLQANATIREDFGSIYENLIKKYTENPNSILVLFDLHPEWGEKRVFVWVATKSS